MKKEDRKQLSDRSEKGWNTGQNNRDSDRHQKNMSADTESGH